MGVTTSYPGDPHDRPFSPFLDKFTFRNGNIISASLYTRAAGQPPDYFNGPTIDIGTGYGPGGDVAITDLNVPPVLFGYSDGPGTWTLASDTSLITPAFKVEAQRIASTSDSLIRAISFGGLVGAIIEADGFSAILSILVANIGDETFITTADGESAFAACEEAGGAEFPLIGPAVCGLAAVVVASHLITPVAQAIADDPFDPNYNQIFMPTIETLPADLTGVCSDLTATAEAAPLAIDQTSEWLNALYITNNRYQSALQAGNGASAALQAAAFGNYLTSFRSASRTAGSDLRCFSELLASENIGNQLATQQDEDLALRLLSSADTQTLNSLANIFGLTSADLARLITSVENNPPLLPTETADEALNRLADNFAPQSVPEPSSAYLLLVGVFIIGSRYVFTFRRSRRL